jgi:hypothetical protein
LSIFEIEIICNVISAACKLVPAESFQTRMGYYIQDVKALCVRLKGAASENMLIDNKSRTLKLSIADYYIIWQAFNEICFGVRIDNHEQVAGINKQDLVKMFDEWMSLREER